MVLDLDSSGFTFDVVADKAPGGFGIIHGLSGVGKTFVAVGVSRAGSEAGTYGVICDCENGTRHYAGVRIVTPTSETNMLEIFHRFSESNNPEHRVLFVDTISQFVDQQVAPGICRRHGADSLASVPYGKGVAETVNFARKFCDAADYLAAKGKWLIALCHSQAKTVNDPAQGTYDRVGLKLPQPFADLLTERADFVGYAYRSLVTRKVDNRTIATGVGGGGGDRLIQFQPTPSVLAKSRLGHTEAALPLSWASLGIKF